MPERSYLQILFGWATQGMGGKLQLGIKYEYGYNLSQPTSCFKDRVVQRVYVCTLSHLLDPNARSDILRSRSLDICTIFDSLVDVPDRTSSTGSVRASLRPHLRLRPLLRVISAHGVYARTLISNSDASSGHLGDVICMR